jgi:uncharacterized membrane protein
MAVELPTAFPYFAAIAAVGSSGRGTAAEIGLIGVYDVCFVLPLVGVLVARAVAGPRGERVLAGARDWTQRNAPAVLALTLVAIAFALVALALT